MQTVECRIFIDVTGAKPESLLAVGGGGKRVKNDNYFKI